MIIANIIVGRHKAYIDLSFPGLDPSAKQLKAIQLQRENLQIRMCPVYIGSNEANKRCFLHFCPSDFTAIEPMLLRHNYAMRSDPMKIDFLPTNGTLALKILPRKTIPSRTTNQLISVIRVNTERNCRYQTFNNYYYQLCLHFFYL
ncbi:hypothetical protein Tsp_15340 [Trichinella spiralis]|uniref:hypothetical protein n=1 Tax=Trichinella spiralis TaxID=6334 RepID=UPI0001EFE66B|nr:hypothetical protein Tsp_15340 [Trichinella spiralis]